MKITPTTENEIIRIMGAVIEDLRETHRDALTAARTDPDGHTSLTERPLQGVGDVPCLTCGHINEADYFLAELIA